MSLYAQRGVSAQKEEVHAATRNLDKGLYPAAFCKLYPDYLTGDDQWVNIMHADGAGTKSILAYLYWKETGDASVWKGIAQDAIVMNLDDLLCVGIYNKLLFSSTIDRNKLLIPGEVLEEIINGSQEFFHLLETYGVHIRYLGGETADVGDVVRTIAVNGTMAARWPKSGLITNERIGPGDVIVGLASFGTARYEREYNSGIGSNGLTSARHDMLSKFYAGLYPETFENSLTDDVVYIGKYRLTDHVPNGTGEAEIGRLLLSPTRTYAPLLVPLLKEHFQLVHGLVHCSGGGQTKCMKYLPGNFRIVKDNLFEPPVIFRLIQEASGADNYEMHQVFNMGHRMEIFTHEREAQTIIDMASSLGIEARVIGRVEAAEKKELIIQKGTEQIVYDAADYQVDQG
ncbi:MAG: phosphoribosylformylglycinamidine cyclo-ligase [Williamsia sp.]|nr:phosphoribosylformylglycinamidine cyclo-ligase [Williamsia sp.]